MTHIYLLFSHLNYYFKFEKSQLLSMIQINIIFIIFIGQIQSGNSDYPFIQK
jgi:hypothetical protein